MTTASTNIVTVRVDDTVSPRKVICSPEKAEISGANALLTFQLETPGYAFREAQAIVVHEGGNQFPYPSWTTLATTAALFDLNTEVGDFRYRVHVVKISTGEELSVDPTIVNGT